MNVNLVLQSFVVPICRINAETKSIDRLFGTAFFTSVPGVFITARHVYQEVSAQILSSNRGQYGLCVKGQNNENLFALLKKENIEFAPNNLDIAIGRVDFASKSPIKLVREPLSFMQDVITYGYPVAASASEQIPNIACWMDMRGNKGYVNREIGTKAKALIGGEADAELSFRIEAGMSGAPLFTSNQFHVGGVCIGTRTSEAYEHRINENEKELRHLEYGVACMTSCISSWNPTILKKTEYEQLFL
jgi:hypothetical protein